MTNSRRARRYVKALFSFIVLYVLGSFFTKATLPDIAESVEEAYHPFVREGLYWADGCIDWPLAKPFFVKYHIADVRTIGNNQLRGKLGAYGVYRIQLADFVIYGDRHMGPSRCTQAE